MTLPDMRFLLSFRNQTLTALLESFLPRYFPDIPVSPLTDLPEKKGSAILFTDDDGLPEKTAAAVLVFANNAAGTPDNIALPFRAGHLVDRLHRLISAGKESGKEPLIPVGSYRLNICDGGLRGKDGDTVLYLTEKEQAILHILYQAGGQTVNRKTLLNRVWEYADGVETHTLETHIYRLRRKIEDDPAGPKILLTAEDGYALVME